jgi:hypothetical protein
MNVRTALLVLAVAWASIAVCLYITAQFEPVPALAPASGSCLPLAVEPDANLAAQSACFASTPGWAAPTDNSKGK